MIIHRNDDKVFLGLTKHQISHAQKKGCYVIKALKSVSNSHKNCENITWREAYKSASNILLSNVCRHTIERWFLIYKDNNESFSPN